jgi:TonB family protein
VSLALHAAFAASVLLRGRESEWRRAGEPPVILSESEHARAVRLIEVPGRARAERAPDAADFSSDKPAVASTPDPQAGGIDLPQSDGEVATPSFGSGASAAGELPREQDAGRARPGGGLPARGDRPDIDYAPGALVGLDSIGDVALRARASAPTGSAGAPAPSLERAEGNASGDGPAFAQPLPSSLGLGGVSFNTLEWDFAPYALELKRRIGSNWYPPIAFTHGGLFGGVSVVRFRVEPDGSLGSVELLSAAEHSSLDTAALNAVRHSARFAPLPVDFPEPFLEVTFSFHYLLDRDRPSGGGRRAGS